MNTLAAALALLLAFSTPAFAQSVDAMGVSSGTPTKTELEMLMVWQKRNGEWKLLARQAYKV